MACVFSIVYGAFKFVKYLFIAGFMGTNTSQEIEALHKALREVGLSPTIKTDSQHFDNSFFGNKSTSEHAELLQKILNGEADQRTGRFRSEHAELLQKILNGETDQHTGKVKSEQAEMLQEILKCRAHIY